MAKLPQQGRWQLVNPWLGEGAPFGILNVDFATLLGSARWWIEEAALSSVAKTGIDSFSARYALRSKSGAFRARLRDDGELEMDFYQGPPILKCRAVPRGETQWRVARMAILTCVGNPGWPTGPGHGALIGDGDVYTFERPNMTSSTSGWDVLTTSSYLAKTDNLARPIIIQELNMSRVNAGQVMDYIHRSIRADEDFISSGWCSLQSAAALAVGVSGGFDPTGLNTPLAVHDRVKSLGLVTKTYRIWDTAKTPAQHVSALVQQLSQYYYGVVAPVGPDVRTW